MECQVIGSEHWVDDSRPEQLCAQFMEQMGDAQSRVAQLTLTLSPRGSIRADIIDREGRAHDLTRDVMDRPMRAQDLDKLAADVAALLQT